jgi:hypothetical protein
MRDRTADDRGRRRPHSRSRSRTCESGTYRRGCAEHPGQLVGQAETPLGHREKHHTPVRGQATAVEGSCDFLGVNRWKREWQNRIIGHGGRGVRG